MVSGVIVHIPLSKQLQSPLIIVIFQVVEEALMLHWRGPRWHYFRTSVLEKLVKHAEESNVVSRVLGEKSHLPFMGN